MLSPSEEPPAWWVPGSRKYPTLYQVEVRRSTAPALFFLFIPVLPQSTLCSQTVDVRTAQFGQLGWGKKRWLLEQMLKAIFHPWFNPSCAIHNTPAFYQSHVYTWFSHSLPVPLLGMFPDGKAVKSSRESWALIFCASLVYLQNVLYKEFKIQHCWTEFFRSLVFSLKWMWALLGISISQLSQFNIFYRIVPQGVDLHV